MADNNCFPVLEAKRHGSGAILIDKNDTWSGTALIWVFAAPWNAFITYLLFNLTKESFDFDSLFLIPFAIVGWVMLYAAVKQTLNVMRLHPGQLYVGRWPIRLGENIDLKFQRKAKSNTPFSKVEATLSVCEVATYRVGTDTRTVTEEIWSLPLEAETFGHTFEANCSWQVPIPDGMPPSFSSPNNKIQWWLKLNVHYGSTQDDSEFQILVAPEIAS